MSKRHLNEISNRLSLRKPQRDSLAILQRICEIISLSKDADVKEQLEVIKSEFEGVNSFDRDFISLCFALATGVGKTRLMGAFIAYLHLSEGIKHFLILAPNLTIYNKLISDFKQGSPKYVFRGIGAFTQNVPLLITGDDYESGIALRADEIYQDNIHINIFNIAKLTAKDKGHYEKNDKRRAVPRIRRLREEMGESYFDYLAGLDDLVLLMDESHRYRADAGMSAINELKPILGLELTATPQLEKGNNTIPFNNVIYYYPLANAMIDGYVKEPAVATRENFDSSAYSENALEKLKLEDGIRIHENTKVELFTYAKNNEKEIVKPFMLVVAIDTTHANDLQRFMESAEFFDGRYQGKIITVHSNIRGEEKDDVIQQLLTVEDPRNPIEIVIHVNMLKEGWDVTNLYTIVPLRAANSKTLVEQSIGRGLRLPYGKRVGDNAVDTLTIVSHDKFQEIVDYANNPDSIIKRGIIIGKDIPESGKKAIESKPIIARLFEPEESALNNSNVGEINIDKIFESQEELNIAQAAYSAISLLDTKINSKEILSEENQQKLHEIVKEKINAVQIELDLADAIPEIIKTVSEKYCELLIDIPRIIVIPKGEEQCKYEDFDLNLDSIHLQPVAQNILIQHLNSITRTKLHSESNFHEEKRPEDYIVRGLIDKDDIHYDETSDLLYKLAAQVVTHLKSYLSGDEEVINVLQYHQRTLVELVYSQMQKKFKTSAAKYEAKITKGFQTIKTNNYTIPNSDDVRNFRIHILEGQRNNIKALAFNGFEKCIYSIQKFDSYPEIRFARVLENDSTVLKWFKPGRNEFRIYPNNDKNYEPDFVVETKTRKYLCEPKRSDLIDSDEVQNKAKAAAKWCKYASKYASENSDKEWSYLLISHEAITEQSTLAGLAATYLYMNVIDE